MLELASVISPDNFPVVPANKKEWPVDPFAGKIKNNFLIGRGAVDMKSAIACFLSAAKSYLNENKILKGKISMMITSDEETWARLGTRKILHWLKKKNIKIDNCLVGEPTILQVLGDKNIYLVMSETAYKSLDNIQICKIKNHCPIIRIPVETIEKLGGGSVRCMMTEIFLLLQH